TRRSAIAPWSGVIALLSRKSRPPADPFPFFLEFLGTVRPALGDQGQPHLLVSFRSSGWLRVTRGVSAHWPPQRQPSGLGRLGAAPLLGGADHGELALVHRVELFPQDRLAAGERVLQSDVPTGLPGERLGRE